MKVMTKMLMRVKVVLYGRNGILVFSLRLIDTPMKYMAPRSI